MGWDASLLDNHCKLCGRGDEVYETNYTHNCNRMMATVLEDHKYTLTEPWFKWLGKAWWDVLNGKTGEHGARVLSLLVDSIEADPQRFRPMEPDNGWGSYDSVLEVLKQMRKASRENPSAVWNVSG